MKTNVKKLCVTALFTALMCVLSPLTVPMPIGVPITLQTLIIAVTAFLLDAKRATAATVCYVLIGTAGLPVFSGFGAGAGALLSPTGGFIFAFPFYTLLLSLVFYVNKNGYRVILMSAAIILLYLSGTIQFMALTGTRLTVVLSGFILYFIKDVAVVFAAYFLCVRIRPTVRKFIQSK